MSDKNNTSPKKASEKKKKTPRQILAIAGIVLIVALYVVTFVLSLFNTPACRSLFGISLIATIMVPILLYCFSLLSGRSARYKDYNTQALNPDNTDPEK